MAPPLMVVQVIGSSSRVLNSSGQSIAADLEFSSVADLGYSEFSCVIPYAEWNSFKGNVYTFGSIVNVRENNASGTVRWSGYLKSPVPQADGSVKLTGIGWGALLEEREEPILWQDKFAGSWTDTDDDDVWAGNFGSDDSVDVKVKKDSIRIGSRKGTEMKTDDQGVVGWYYQGGPGGINHKMLRIAGRIKQQIVNPGGNWSLKLRRYAGPQSYGSQHNVNDFQFALNNADNSDFDIEMAAPTNCMTFEMIFTAPNKDLTTTFFIVLNRLKMNGDGYRTNPADWDNYVASEVIRDIAFHMDFAIDTVTATTRNVLPLWWQDGTWAELMDYLTLSGTPTGGAFRWCVWGLNASNKPLIEFIPWNSAPVRSLTCYSQGATGVAELAPSDDQYARVSVEYRRPGSPRIRHWIEPVTPNPFAGLPGPNSGRKRTFKFAMQDPIGDGTATNVAQAIAADLATEQFSGDITIAPNYLWRAGDRCTISDFPGGSKTFRVYEAKHSQTETVLTVGRIPLRFERMMWWLEKRRQRRGRVNASPQ